MITINFINPDKGVTEKQQITKSKIDFGDGYTQTVLHGIRPKKEVLSLTWTVPYAYGLEMYRLFKEIEDSEPILYAHFDNDEKQYMVSNVSGTNKAPYEFIVKATFTEDFNIAIEDES